MEGNIGFIGLGAMGYGMAHNIRLKMPKESTFYINDVFEESCTRFIEEHKDVGPIEILSTAREIAEKSAYVVTMVPAAQHVKQVYLDEKDGIIAAPKNPSRLLLECSTIDVQSTRDVGAALSAAGSGVYIDAPVSGGAIGAYAGTITLMIGSPKAPDHAHPHLHALAAYMGPEKKLFYMGALGSGLALKIVNNYLAGVHLLAAAEAMNMGVRAGVDRKTLFDVIHVSSGQSFMHDYGCPVPGILPHAPSSNDYKAGFKPFMMVKDMGLGIETAKQLGVRVATGAAALQVYEEAAKDVDCKDRDVSVVYRFLGGPE